MAQRTGSGANEWRATYLRALRGDGPVAGVLARTAATAGLGAVEIALSHAALVERHADDISDHARGARLLREVLSALPGHEAAGEDLGHRAMMRFAAGVAHDINNLLGAISTSCEFLAEEIPESGEAAHDLRSIRDATTRGSALMRRLSSYAERQILTPVPLELSAWLESIAPSLRAALGAGTELELHLAARAPVVADPAELEASLVELAVNAAEAMQGRGKVLISTRLSDDGRMAELIVCDEGPGMDAATLARAKEPYFTTKPRRHGRGLGLAVAHGLVRQSGGELTLESAPGRGTTARLRVPARGAIRTISDSPR